MIANRTARNALAFLIGAIVVAVPAVSQAALPTGVETAFTGMTSDFSTLFGYGFTALIAIVGSMMVWKYTKKLASKV